MRTRVILSLLLVYQTAVCQNFSSDTIPAATDADSVDVGKTVWVKDTALLKPYKFKPAQLIVPGVLVGVGFIGLESDWLKYQNSEVRDELQEDGHNKFGVDDITQYVPMASAYALQLCGVKGRHSYLDKSIILATAWALTGASVLGVKNLTKVERPDHSARNSFPSGHTATAFMGAEFLRREYWNVSPWIGVGGYAVATFTGFFRMYNNRHWLTDVIAGAGIGILSVQVAYWFYPYIKKLIFPGQYRRQFMISPFLNGSEKGLALSMTF